ncbi:MULTISPECIES: glycerophosphodiester phosphodiesterase family protein [Leeuwenhoekiella]|jgi:glycerophosphoryl diester phosphodiesterase|uniref:Glycerophosphoryl diester phosphodiesterase n=1 Tax=Leeuwenhoekiella blandensis (strain CECT 7118 / CCUG 51940 / KCTC 22103 / MED217) TaxID=398720 RepID=A3XL27_LEEBM|nr:MULTISPECIES: glycerophosphodiester phosphodiesterase family protein [Leeuwenhoekiella]EAQ49746.1 glycerophosphoryl diester phosphodiesterase [Leeuwenhoekiella blandensis MED217]MAO43833.1 glycerophosphodiester phosphodiesterase [Leeuwenhoekiella sp.]MBQ52270.1 glycerophosphodiester phosphodiesterase [Leeuwenhoekiella sp.]HCW64344.1 glycerophosphodiester phosphodiesterase [Leeuwenhoekiella sp.]|tara:strand:+ start:325004 stop:325924 length:921 start_codon:yes stop_codon:yes gene_type:complete
MKTLLLAGLVVATLFSCKSKSEESKVMHTPQKDRLNIQVQGHRGERGNLPENSIPAFLGALRKGVDVLELDVVISKDQQVVVSHEPVMLPLYMLTPEGDSIPQDKEKEYNLYQMDYAEIKQFDGGSKGNVRFSQQQKMKTYKPLLSEVFDTVAASIKEEGLKPVKFNIEIKSVPEEYDVFQPQPEAFVDLVMGVIQEKQMEEHINLQSFDPAILEVVHTKYPEIELAYLVGENTYAENKTKLSFQPEIYSPYFKLLDTAEVAQIHKDGLKVIPWTVNEPEDIDAVIALKVDAIITDYPERVLEKLK